MPCCTPLRALIGVLFLTSLISASSHATQILPRTPDQLADSSQSVVRGTVVQERSFWNESGTRILTEIEIEVQESYKGSAPQRVRILQMGGVVGTTRMTVAGALSWSQGEDVLVFLETSLPGNYRVAGFTQGKYEVEQDPRSGELLVRQPAMLGVELAGASKASTDASITMPLRELLESAQLSVKEVK